MSLDEFLRSTQKKDFSNPKEWEVRSGGGAVKEGGEEELCHTSVTSPQTLDTRPSYTEEELQRFEGELRAKEEELSRRRENLQQEQQLLQERSKALELQRKEYQQVSVAAHWPDV